MKMNPWPFVIGATCGLVAFFVGYAFGKLDCVLRQSPLDPLIEREINICLTNNDALIGTVTTLTDQLNSSTDTLIKTTASLDECVVLAQALLQQVGISDDDLARVCPMWAKFTKEPCPP
jgi:hypothetical protein